jgi:ubiquitin thioesterase protein OTUB1
MDDLSPSQIYDLNQSLLEQATDITRPLIDSLVSISELRNEYENGNKTFLDQIDALTSKGFSHIRRARGDGDCFFRAFAFAYVHRCPGLHHLATTPNLLESVGFQSLVFEDFYDVLQDLIQRVEEADEAIRESLLESAFQNPESNLILIFLLLILIHFLQYPTLSSCTSVSSPPLTSAPIPNHTNPFYSTQKQVYPSTSGSFVKVS